MAPVGFANNVSDIIYHIFILTIYYDVNQCEKTETIILNLTPYISNQKILLLYWIQTI